MKGIPGKIAIPSVKVGNEVEPNFEETTLPAGVDSWGRFLRSDFQRSFVTYCLEQRNVALMSTIVFLITVWAFLDTVATILLNDLPTSLYFGAPVLLLTFGTWIVLSLISFSVWAELNSSSFWKSQQFQGNAQSLLIVLIFSVVILKVLEQVTGYGYVCKPLLGMDSRFESQSFPNCPSPASFLSIVSQDMILVMCFCPMLLSPLFYEPRYYLVVILQLITGFLAVYSVLDSFYSAIPMVVVLVAISVSGYELHRQRMKSFLDRNQLKRMLREREENADRLHALEMRSMIGNVAHDLKTPLSSFITGIDLIEEVIAHTKRKLIHENSLVDLYKDCLTSIQGYLDNIRNTNSFMLMTINRCIDYTKASKGMKLVPKNETLCLRDVLEFPIDCMRNIQERIGIKLEPLAKEICSHIITDKQWLQENLLCLLSNAVKYSSEGEVTIEVSLVVEKPIGDNNDQTLTYVSNYGENGTAKRSSEEEISSEKGNWEHNNSIAYCGSPTSVGSGTDINILVGYLVFEIEDSGIGISEAARKCLFSPFKQAQRMAGGTGLGLYSLARRVEALHGSYGVKNRRDGEKGSLFWFAIPYRPDLSSAEMKDSSLTSDRKRSISHTRQILDQNLKPSLLELEILVVDDSPSILKMSSMMLKRQGHKIWTAENGAIALKQIEEKWKETSRGYDLVLMDLQMPVMDGLEATRRLRSLEAMEPSPENESVCAGKHQLVIGVSANSDHETMKDALSVGFDEFISKPFTADTLAIVLEKFVHYLNK